MNKTDSIPSFWSHCANVKIKTDEQLWCHTATVFGMGSGFICAAGSRSARDKPQAFLSCQSLPSFLAPQQKRKEREKKAAPERERGSVTRTESSWTRQKPNPPRFPSPETEEKSRGSVLFFLFFSHIQTRAPQDGMPGNTDPEIYQSPDRKSCSEHNSLVWNSIENDNSKKTKTCNIYAFTAAGVKSR